MAIAEADVLNILEKKIQDYFSRGSFYVNLGWSHELNGISHKYFVFRRGNKISSNLSGYITLTRSGWNYFKPKMKEFLDKKHKTGYWEDNHIEFVIEKQLCDMELTLKKSIDKLELDIMRQNEVIELFK